MGQGAGRAGRDLEPEHKLQVIVPVYNEGETARELYRDLRCVWNDFDSLRFVYDFPEDTTVPVIRELGQEDARVEGIMNDRGKGVINALQFAFSKVESGPVIVLMGDRSDKLEVIAEAVQHWRDGSTIVSPSRYCPGGRQHGGPWIKGVLSSTAGRFLAFLGFPTSDPTNNFKLYDGEWLQEQVVESEGGFEVALELCYKAFCQRQKITELPSEWWDRASGESNFKLAKWLPHYLHWYFKAIRAVVFSRLSRTTRSA